MNEINESRSVTRNDKCSLLLFLELLYMVFNLKTREYMKCKL